MWHRNARSAMVARRAPDRQEEGTTGMNIAHLLTEAASRRAGHPAFEFEGRVFTYAELDRRTDCCAHAFERLDAGREQVVAIFLDSSPELLVAYLGALKAGAVPNVVNGSLQPEEVQHIVADSDARVLVTDPERWATLGSMREGLGVRHVLLTGEGGPVEGTRPFVAALAEAPEHFEALDLPEDTLASLLYTSGTTGQPKGVMLSHLNIVDNARTFAWVHYAPDDRLLITAP